MNDKDDKALNNHHPLIIESEEKEIEVQKPPNDKIISHRLISKTSED